MSDIKGKYFTTADYNKFTSDILDTKIKQNKQTNKQKTFNKFNISNLVKSATGLDPTTT